MAASSTEKTLAYAQKSKSTLHTLAAVLQAPPEPEVLVTLSQLLESLPIGFHISDTSGDFHIVYANPAWERLLGPEKLPVLGKAFADVFPGAERAGLPELMREVLATGKPKHLRAFKFADLGATGGGSSGETGHWDWEIYPLRSPVGITHLLNVMMDVDSRHGKRSALSKEERRAMNRRLEEASGVLRIFGQAEDTPTPGRERLTGREYQVAELLATGLTNAAIGQHLTLSSATICSHVAHILSKLDLRSRAQVAVWVVRHRAAAARKT
ncbi:MAG: LuxR C-terminal-related transcriptional regulator [Candidatus Dormibacteraeota bacterium]|nr:LuxR C-terminal-related transcriptional regulator [Candidatus Dormibacteraeota bacterium]